ncbi:dUTP diphosphatase [Niallia sp. NCCP-28]|uniref:dUTP diphosphatase n=1 Tax=Niallia sp. NCCP-28 TaxID=2934712 RepID=UPI002087003F|nr:dUTP diphosphatase [Niallia sp. NCCP-28]GKU81223.1 hypothetical protein NCCP28_06190 [Niallia sp. NCCP-28]
MNLAKLFEKQKVLRDRIGYQGEDRFEKLILALLVELGECANEWRGFKFWSKNQNPRTKAARAPYMDIEDADFYNPLLDEYVDGVAFGLELCIELGLRADQLERFIDGRKKKIGSMEYHFGYIYHSTSELMNTGSIEDRAYKMLHIFNAFLGLGYRLGFTWEQIEQAYYTKMQINHVRQSTGY